MCNPGLTMVTGVISGLAAFVFLNFMANAADHGQATMLAPQFQVDPDWPKPLPNNWQVGQVAGVAVAPDDTIWVVHRPRTLDNSEAGATDAEPGIFVCNEGGQLKERDGTCEEGDEFESPVAADAFGHPRPHGPISSNSIPAPSVLHFDRQGNLLGAWGGPRHHGKNWGWPDPLWTEAEGVSCQWPAGEHALHVDRDGYLYLTSNGAGDGSLEDGLNDTGWDGQLLKFTPDGTCVLQIGMPLGEGSQEELANSNDTDGGINGTPRLYRPANSHVSGDDLYIADGYGNRRIVVVDKNSGMYKRHWGAYGDVSVDDTLPGNFADDRPAEPNPPRQFRTPTHCVRVAEDGNIYVCDRVNNRIQVFDQSVGTNPDCTDPSREANNGCGFLFETFTRSETLGPGTVWDLALSPDEEQTCVHQADGSNQKVDTLYRPTLQHLDSFGQQGRQPGAFHWIHDIAADSRGNLYTTEVDTGKRAQKFIRIGRRSCREEAD